MTAKENNQHALDNGLKFNRVSVFSNSTCLEMYELRETLNKRTIAELYNVNLSTVYRAIYKGKELTIKQ